MKRLIYLFAIVLLISSCKKDGDGMAYSGEYHQSYRAWQNFQTQQGDSYVYQRETGSWVGYSVETTITVKQGKIVERSYVLKARQPANGPLVVVQEWKEDATQLGTHDNAHELLTLEEIYTKAKSEWLTERDDARTYFETENDGMISLCGFTKNGCADDCFNGAHITFIRPL